MRRGLRLGSVQGIDIIADLSLFVIAGLLTWSLYAELERAYPATESGLLLLSSVVGGGLFLGSVLLHELSHSLVAIRRGLTVRRIRLFVFGGVSEIEDEAETPSDELAITLAGPLASLILGVVFLGVGWPLTAVWDLVGRIGIILGFANISIAIFNILPGLPLDGGRVLRALVWRRSGDRAKATRLAVGTGRGLGLLLAAVGMALMFLAGDLSAVWFVAVGWFLYEAASTSAIQERFMARISGLSVSDVMRRTDVAIDGDLTVTAALDLHGWGDKLRTMPVSVDGRVLGVFGTREVAGVEAARRGLTLVRDAMTVIGPGDVVSADVGLREALSQSSRWGSVFVVVDSGEVVGLVTAEELSDMFADLRHRRGQ